MSNVLPAEKLQIEWNRFKNRLVLLGALVFLGTAVLAWAALLPAYVALQVEKTIAEQQSAKNPGAPADTNQQTQSERADVMRAQSLLDSVAPLVSATSSPTEVIKAVLALRPSGVRVNHITFVSSGGGVLTVEGTSPGRDSTNQYRRVLSKSGRFRSVTVPVGALVGAEGGDFTITLTGTI